MGSEEWSWGYDDIKERFDANALELEEEVSTELAGRIFSFSFFVERDDFGRRTGPDDENDKVRSRPALRFCFPRSTSFLATVVWSLSSRSN
jgi:hypothetical protein